ncbi:hypothetical protein POVWA1_050640 [Plasmodium ovale wallikeri]|uniref:Uncharacterized protein n=1 Tax=Plasmodium ovale wallikeri TaxID=864142 RepID=A0A1A8ZLR9_PLAOA|nr:hypothetical protein POVWA1_050640 [Plasmodium ovale wallikeri]
MSPSPDPPHRSASPIRLTDPPHRSASPIRPTEPPHRTKSKSDMRERKLRRTSSSREKAPIENSNGRFPLTAQILRRVVTYIVGKIKKKKENSEAPSVKSCH